MNILAWVIFVAAAVLEVGGDAAVRRGLQTRGVLLIVAGFAMLGCYGIVVNLANAKWDFSRLLGVYVAVFAVVSVLWGKFLFGDRVPTSTWVGLGVILVGAAVIHFGPAWSGDQ